MKEYSYKDKKWLIENIEKYKTIIELCKETGYPSTSIRRYIKLYDLESICEKPAPKRKYAMDEHYFSNIDCEEKAYLLGMIVADGNVMNEKNIKFYIRILLKNEDIYLLRVFKNLIKTESDIYINPYGRGTLRVYSKIMFNDLSKLGVHPNKTGKEEIPIIRSDLYRHFVRGFFDGDGTIYRRKNRKRHKCTVGFCCQNEEYMKSFIEIIKDECGVEFSYYKHVNNVYEAKTESVKKCTDFLNWIYEESTIAMIRKYNRANEYLNITCPSLEQFKDECRLIAGTSL